VLSEGAAGRIPRSIYEEARDVARALAKTEAFDRSRRARKRVKMLFAHLKRIFRLGRLRLRGPCGAQFEFTLAETAQNLRRLAKLVVRPPPVTEACFAFSGNFAQRHLWTALRLEEDAAIVPLRSIEKSPEESRIIACFRMEKRT
jgi:hypothetical protein